MADYQTELSQSGTTLYLKPADGFQRSTVMGNSVANDHQFTGSVLISGSAANEVNIIAGQFEAWVETGTLSDGTGSLRIGLDSLGQPADPGTISLTDGNSSFSLSNGCGLVYGAPQNPAMPVEPLITFEVHYTGSGSPVHMGTAGSVPFGGGGGEVVFFGTGSTTYGSLYYLNTDGGWEMVNANATGSLGTTGAGNASLLGIAQGLAATGSGMLVRGYQEVYSGSPIPGMVSPAWTGSWATGSAVYIYSGSYSGMMTCTPPEASDSYVRIVGHCTDTPNVIYFNPDSTWVENS